MKKIACQLRGILHSIVFLAVVIPVLNSCRKSHPPGEQTAKGSLQGVDGNCLPGTVHGTWYAGVGAGGDSNYVDVGVDVSRVGSYRIKSDSVHGVIFSAAGQFSSTGLQTVRLKASGAFNVIGPVGFTITFDSSVCGFGVDVKVPPLTDNTWHGTFGGRTYWGSGAVVVTFFGGDNAFDLSGAYALGSDTTLAFRVRMPQRADGYGVTLGTYKSSNPGASFFLRAGGVPFLTAQGSGPGIVTIVVTSQFYYPNGSVQYDGTFSGTCRDAGGNLVEVKDGVFRAGSQ